MDAGFAKIETIAILVKQTELLQNKTRNYLNTETNKNYQKKIINKEKENG